MPSPWAASCPCAGSPLTWGCWRGVGEILARHHNVLSWQPALRSAPSEWPLASAGSGVWHKHRICCPSRSMPSEWYWELGACHESLRRNTGPKEQTEKGGGDRREIFNHCHHSETLLLLIVHFKSQFMR